MSSRFALLSAALVGLGVLGCGARSNVYCPRGECRSDIANPGFGDGDFDGFGGGAASPDVTPPDTVSPPSALPDPPSSVENPDVDLPLSPRDVETSCRNGTRVSQNVTIERARDLDLLRGCREIDGDLTLAGFVTDDLLALSSLERVTGTLYLGFSGSLEGLESLQRVGALTLENVDTQTLQPLGTLSEIGRAGDETAVLEIRRAENLVDLRGLSAIRQVSSIEIASNRSLQSLRGLNLPSSLIDLTVRSNPSLIDLGDNANLGTATRVIIDDNRALVELTGIAALQRAEILTLDGLALQSLSILQNLTEVIDLSLSNNDYLVDVSVLAQVRFVSLELAVNSVLQTLPMFRIPDRLHQLQIRDNPSLSRGPNFPNVASANRVAISRNAALTRIDGFPQLSRIETLEIRANPSLAAVELQSLTEFSTARIICNAVLPESTLAPQLQTGGGSLELRGNLDSIEPCN